MLDKILKKEESQYQSWYDLSKKETSQLEKEFISKDMGKEANDAMHICIVLAVCLLIICSFVLGVMVLFPASNPYLFVLMLLLVACSMVIVVGSTIEYHIKFNSWLKVSKKIIKK